ncbi:flagellar hook-basal body complex protein FliE [Paenibacillus sp. HJGM_3]|uniref:flagellar hook-basal body complex protein FliE n=1 Tax=Paenibacillus sp. HJGM_3 TaxID=3379816 RepID=UPI00385D00B9
MIDKIGMLTKPVTAAVSAPKAVESPGAVDVSKSFGSFLSQALGQVQAQQEVTDVLNEKFITGDLSDVHQLTIAAEKASLGLELTVQIRNKAIEAYQEIMRTQI